MKYNKLSLLLFSLFFFMPLQGQVQTEDLFPPNSLCPCGQEKKSKTCKIYNSAYGNVLAVNRVIESEASVVWEKMRDPNSYESFTDVLSASTEEDGEGSVVGAKIKLKIKLWKHIPKIGSKEIISKIDDEKMIISWKKKMQSGYTERPQFIYPLEDGKSCYVTMLVLPKNFMGKLTYKIMGAQLIKAFDAFSRDLSDSL